MYQSAYGEFNAETGLGNGPNTRYVTYWLNPSTMQVSSTPFQTSTPTSNYAALCPDQQRAPRVGTFVAELTSASLFAFRWFIYAVLYTPGMIKIWEAGGACPAPGAGLRHSILANCGQDLYSLDDFFDSLADASAVFWNTLTVVAQLIPDPSGTVDRLLNGAAYLGEVGQLASAPASAASPALQLKGNAQALGGDLLASASFAVQQAAAVAKGIAAEISQPEAQAAQEVADQAGNIASQAGAAFQA